MLNSWPTGQIQHTVPWHLACGCPEVRKFGDRRMVAPWVWVWARPFPLLFVGLGQGLAISPSPCRDGLGLGCLLHPPHSQTGTTGGIWTTDWLGTAHLVYGAKCLTTSKKHYSNLFVKMTSFVKDQELCCTEEQNLDNKYYSYLKAYRDLNYWGQNKTETSYSWHISFSLLVQMNFFLLLQSWLLYTTKMLNIHLIKW